jgi:hypothetical protein
MSTQAHSYGHFCNIQRFEDGQIVPDSKIMYSKYVK